MANETSLHPFRDLYDAAIRCTSVRVVCDRCKHTAVFQTAALWRYFNRRGWDDGFDAVQRRLYCLFCWHHGRVKRRPCIFFCDDVPTETRFPMPTKQEWAHEARRRR